MWKGRKLLDFSSLIYFLHPTCLFSGLASKREDGDENSCNSGSNSSEVGDKILISEDKKLLRLVNVDALKWKQEMDGEEVIGYSDPLKACERMGVARSAQEAAALARVLREAGVVLPFRDKVYLHSDKHIHHRLLSTAPKRILQELQFVKGGLFQFETDKTGPPPIHINRVVTEIPNVQTGGAYYNPQVQGGNKAERGGNICMGPQYVYNIYNYYGAHAESKAHCRTVVAAQHHKH